MTYRTYGTILSTCVLFQFSLSAAVLGDNPINSQSPDWRVEKEKLHVQQRILARRFENLMQDMLTLKARLDRSDRQSDRRLAGKLQKALSHAREASLEARLQQLLAFLKNNKLANLAELETARDEASKIADELRTLVDLLVRDPNLTNLRGEEDRLRKVIRLINGLIHDQRVTQRKTLLGKEAIKDLRKQQNQLTGRTQTLLKDLDDELDLTGLVSPKGIAIAKSHLQDAGKNQFDAATRIKENKNTAAATEQGEAIVLLTRARDELQRIVNKINDVATEQHINELLKRCERMLARQYAVINSTEKLAKIITGNKDQQPTRLDMAEANKISDMEQENVTDVSKVIRMLEDDGQSAIVFPAVFRQIREDMKIVVTRLARANTSETTIAIENDVANSLKEIVDALKNRPNNDPPDDNDDNPDPPPPPDETELVSKLTELRLIRNMQKRLNARTRIYGEKCEGEQAADPQVRQELKQLSQRQQDIVAITSDLAKGIRRRPAAGTENRDGTPVSPEQINLVKGYTEFALDFYQQVRSNKGNLFFSPLSLSTGLSMTSAGARGKTLSEMERTLHLLPQEKLHPAMASLMQQLNGTGEDRPYQLSIANALWGQQNYPFLPKFLAVLDKNYQGGLHPVDFRATENARRTINDWVEKQTNNKIKELLQRGVLNASTTLVLTNAVYFKSDWRYQFKKEKTEEMPFFAPSGQTKSPLMHQTAKFRYYGDEDMQMLALPYKGEDLSMVVILPRKRDGLPMLEKNLNTEKLDFWLGQLTTRKVQVWLPRFKMESAFRLDKVLSDMGMPSAFGTQADFSGMDGKRELFISAVVHKAFVAVDEKGTEAAAATAVVLTRSKIANEPESFRADHPFLFLIRDNLSGTILFMGRMENPVQ